MGLGKWVKRSLAVTVLLLGTLMTGTAAEAAYVTDADTGIKVDITNTKIDLCGKSVVITTGSQSNQTSIYLADSTGKKTGNPLKINGATSYDLQKYEIYGYTDTATALNQELNIYMEGGKVKYLYGLYGATYNKAVSTKSVNVKISGGAILQGVYACYQGSITGVGASAGLYLTGGTLKGYLQTATASKISGNSYLEFSGTASLESGSYIRNADASTIGGNVEIMIGSTAQETGSTSRTFEGCATNSTVQGNLNVVVDGFWNCDSIKIITGGSTVNGDFNMDWRSGTLNEAVYCQDNGIINGGFNLYSPENAVIKGTVYAQSEGVPGTVKSVFIDIPKSVSGSVKVENIHENITGLYWVNKRGNLGIKGGDYTFEKDISLTDLSVAADVKCTVKEGVMVSIGGTSDITVFGAVTNKGEIKYTSSGTSSTFRSLTFAGKLINYGTITSTGSFSKIYTTGAFHNYGTVEYSGHFYIGMKDSAADMERSNHGTISGKGSYAINVYGILKNYGTVNTKTDSGATYTGMNLFGTFENETDGTLNLNSKIKNDGTIINYGTLKQTYSKSSDCYQLGTIYTTTALTLGGSNQASYSGANAKLYYKIYKVYAASCVDSVELDSVPSGNYVKLKDGNDYMLAGQDFTVTVGTPAGGYKLKNVTYGSKDTEATDASSGGKTIYTGTMGYEPTKVTLNFESTSGSGTNITLDKNSDSIESLKVGQAYDCIYDLTKLKISNDSGTGQVSYSCKNGFSLPAGLRLENGKILGTPTTVSSDPVIITFIVKGMNGTTAEFVLKINKIEKGDAVLALPTNLSSKVGEKLSSISLPFDSNGTFSWQNGNEVLTSYVPEGAEYTVCYRPNDVANYDWAHATVTAGGQVSEFVYLNGVLTTKVKVTVEKGIPNYKDKLPANGYTAVYNQTLGDITLYSDSAGAFSWQDSKTTKVGAVGVHTNEFYLIYTPKDPNYMTVTAIPVKVTVSPAPAVFADSLKLQSVNAVYGDTLAKISLPVVSDGRYRWITDTSILAQDGHLYKLGYVPNDTVNYDWTGIFGWNATYGYVEFQVTANVAKAPAVFTQDMREISLKATYGDMLKDIPLPNPSYRWIDEETTPVQRNNAYRIGYYPADVEHYDWEQIDGWNPDMKCVAFRVTPDVAKAVPILPDLMSVVKGTYGDVLADIKLQEVTGGKYQWITDEQTKVEDGGIYILGYKPNDTENYDWSKISGWNDESGCVHIEVKAVVAKATPSISELPVDLSASIGQRLSELVSQLPIVSGGKWYNKDETELSSPFVPADGLPDGSFRFVDENLSIDETTAKNIRVIFVPEETAHYNNVEIIIGVTLNHIHEYSSQMESNENMHYRECVKCNAKKDVGFHTWGTMEPTESGEKYTCSVCERTKEEPHQFGLIYNETHHYMVCENENCDYLSTVKTEHSYGSWENVDAEYHQRSCECGYKDKQKHIWDSGLEMAGGEKVYTCEECGAAKVHTHNFSGWSGVDSVSHTRSCMDTGCGYTQTVKHNWNEEETVEGGTRRSCVDCGEEDVHTHAFDVMEQDATHHWYVCECGMTTEKAEHTYGEEWEKKDSTYHWIQCECGAYVEREHSWNTGELLEDGRIKYTCSVCSAIRTHEHDFSEWVYDENGHRKKCVNDDCEEMTELERHDLGDWEHDEEKHWRICECGYIEEDRHEWVAGDQTEAGKITYTCSVCPAIRIHEHDFSEWVYDEDGHRKKCVNDDCEEMTELEGHDQGDWEHDEEKHWRTCECGYIEEDRHEWVAGDKTESGEIMYTCKDCGVEKLEGEDIAHIHNWGDWERDATSHWRRCVCNDTSVPETHKWDAGVQTADGKAKFTCGVCGYVRMEDIPPITQPPAGGSSQSAVVVPIGGAVTSESQNAVVRVTKMGVLDANGNLTGAEATYEKPVKKSATVTVPDVVYDETGKSYQVTAIANDAFKNDKILKTVKIGNNITKIGKGAFSGCVKLKTAAIGGNVSEIGDKAFYKCGSITKITVPANVVRIGKQAFAGCKKLKTIQVKSMKLKNVGSKAISGINKKAVIKVPKKQLKAYKKLFKSKTGFKKTMKIKG